jgi:hypothetical protein
MKETSMNKPISLQDCAFYHVIDLPGLGTQGGPHSWDLRGRCADYIGHVDLTDKTILDVGAASGFLSFEAVRAGAAAVTSYDAESRRSGNLLDGRVQQTVHRKPILISERAIFSDSATTKMISIWLLPPGLRPRRQHKIRRLC